MRGRAPESSQGSRSLVLKMMWRMSFTERLGHARMMTELTPEANRAFSASAFWLSVPWGVAPGYHDRAPLALSVKTPSIGPANTDVDISRAYLNRHIYA